MTETTPPFSSATEQFSGPRSRAWDITDRAYQMERDGQDVIHLGVGDPDLDTPPRIVAAAVKGLKNGRTHYSPIPGEPMLREAVAETYAIDLDVSVDAAQVTIFPGAQAALFAAVFCLAGHGDEVILLEPFYATYEGVAQAGGATVVAVPMSAENNFELDVERIAAAITPKTRIIIANSPGNPSGAVFSESSWQSLLDVCVEHGIWLISDEVYGSLVFDGTHSSPLAIPGVNQNVVVISSLSKSHAMTGWRIGWSVAPLALCNHLANLSQCLLFAVNQFTQDAATFALRNARDEAAEIRDTFRDRRDSFCGMLEQINGLRIHRPAGGMFTMIDVSKFGMDGETFANRLLDDSGVAVVPGFAFGESTRNFVRVGYLHDKEILIDAAGRISRFVSSVGT